MLHLDNSLLIAQGNQRKYYQHPADSNKCIKISKQADNRSQQVEHNYYKKLEQRNVSWRTLSRHYGSVETNLGTGYIFKLIRDFKQKVSRTLSHYFGAEFQTNVK